VVLGTDPASCARRLVDQGTTEPSSFDGDTSCGKETEVSRQQRRLAAGC